MNDAQKQAVDKIRASAPEIISQVVKPGMSAADAQAAVEKRVNEALRSSGIGCVVVAAPDQPQA